jgi:hypothetical protein
MGLSKWSSSNVEYGRQVLSSGLEGARSGREAFLHGRPISPFISESICNVWKYAAVGVCVGALSSIPGKQQRSISRTLTYSLASGVLVLGIGTAWNTRCLMTSIARGARRSIDSVRDEHWLKSHPIDYA